MSFTCKILSYVQSSSIVIHSEILLHTISIKRAEVTIERDEGSRAGDIIESIDQLKQIVYVLR